MVGCVVEYRLSMRSRGKHGKHLPGFKRWMVAVLITFPAIGVGSEQASTVSNAKSVANLE